MGGHALALLQKLQSRGTALGADPLYGLLHKGWLIPLNSSALAAQVYGCALLYLCIWQCYCKHKYSLWKYAKDRKKKINFFHKPVRCTSDYDSTAQPFMSMTDYTLRLGREIMATDALS